MKYEIFLDEGYFHLYAVRAIGDKEFDRLHVYHLASREDAEALKCLLEKTI